VTIPKTMTRTIMMEKIISWLLFFGIIKIFLSNCKSVVLSFQLYLYTRFLVMFGL
jgi:hypothetical protein